MSDLDELFALIERAKSARRKSQVLKQASEKARDNFIAAETEQRAIDNEIYRVINEEIAT